ncbi:vacuolar protein sorting 39 [Arctopsyche grandis]|uniref:vacuolar protein sorting 39 n=1 Tax=Arctopsyche grandis TaxID=121162 RepID=UPI00406D8CB5
MHEAFEISSLLKLTEQIESIAAYDDNLLVATRQGHLMMYLVTPNTDSSKYKIQVLRYHKTFSKKPIQQIDVIPDLSLLLCLSDNILVVHDMNIINFPIVQTIHETKGGTLFAMDHEPAISMTAEKISLIRLAVAVKRKIQLYAWKHNEFKPLNVDITVSDIPKAMVLGKDVICVGFKEEYTIYSLSGTTKGQFITSSSRSMEPCITKMSDTSFMLARDQSSVIVQESTPTMLSESVMKVNEQLIAAAHDAPYILGLLSDQVVVHTIDPPMFIQTLSELNRARLLYKCHRGLLYAASVSQVWRIGAVDITKQRQMLLKDKHFQLAIQLTNMSDESKEEKKQRIDSIQMLYALDLFDNKKFSESMQIFLELDTNPSEIIRLFPDLSTTNKPTADSSNGTKPQNPELENSLLALTEYLRMVRQKVIIKLNPKPVNGETQKGGVNQNEAVAKHNEMTSYQTETEIKQNETTPKLTEAEIKQTEAMIKQNKLLLEIIDTTLLKCYLQTNDAFIGPLLRLNNCKLEEAEQVLLQHKKYSELIILYQTNGQHTKALQFMKDQAKQSDSSLKGFHRTKNYLQHLGAEHINLIFEFSNWILLEQPEEGLKIFTDDILEVENLPRAKVLDFLLREHESLVIPYLEHIIHIWADDNAIYHNALVRILREKMIDTKGLYSDVEKQNCKAKLLSFLQRSNYYSPEMVLVHFPNDSLFEERAIVLGKLDAHEQALSIYVYILDDVQRAIGYCDEVDQKSKDNKKNLDVYVILIRLLVNPTKEVLLNGPLWNVAKTPYKPDIDTALSLLEKHADKIDPLKVLLALPDSVPISRLKKFLEIAVQKQLINRRRMQVLKGLLYAENLQVQELKMIHESQSVVVADYNVCPVCKKRFGNQSAFVRYPNGDIVHYSCQDKK